MQHDLVLTGCTYNLTLFRSHPGDLNRLPSFSFLYLFLEVLKGFVERQAVWLAGEWATQHLLLKGLL